MEGILKQAQHHLQQKREQRISLEKQLAIVKKEEGKVQDFLQYLSKAKPIHIPCDICFCKECLDEARVLEDETLNRVENSNKLRRLKQWSTLGEPSGKWDYYVKYSPPVNTIPIEEITATGWEDNFSDDKDILEKGTILDDKTSGMNQDKRPRIIAAM